MDNSLSYNSEIKKGLINLLMFTLYSDEKTIYREYVQNALDSINKAIDERVLAQAKDGVVNIDIDARKKVIVIKDNGIGIPKDILKYVFDRFYKTDLSRGKDKKGTGLGLAITKQIVELMNGHVELESEVGRGSSFSFTVRMQIPDGVEINESQEIKIPAADEVKESVSSDEGVSLAVPAAAAPAENKPAAAEEKAAAAAKKGGKRPFNKRGQKGGKFGAKAPAAKKFIAVTNVFKDGTSAQDDDAACKSVLEATNAAENFNEVISGTYNGIDFTPAEAGYVYEIFYSALDYSGKISQRKFYVEVQ